MLNPELLALLVCPETHQDLAEATPDEIAWLNGAIRGGKVRNAGGKTVAQPVEGALIRTDRAIAYPVRDDIPVMLVPEGIVLRSFTLTAKAQPPGKAKTKPVAVAGSAKARRKLRVISGGTPSRSSTDTQERVPPIKSKPKPKPKRKASTRG